jgi:hypothetical protein
VTRPGNASPATWAVGLLGGDWELSEISPYLTETVRVTRADDGWELSSDAFADTTDAETVRALAQEIVALVNGLASIWLDDPQPLRVGNVRRYRPDGSKDAWVFPEPVVVRARVFTPSVLINGVASPARSWSDDLDLAGQHIKVQAVLAFLGGTVTWHDLYAALEVILEDERTGGREGVTEWAGVSENRLRRFTRTANSYSAIGTAARHGPRFVAPPRPLEMSQARALINEIARKWLDQLKARSRP